jgi:hypothetical protein
LRTYAALNRECGFDIFNKSSAIMNQLMGGRGQEMRQIVISSKNPLVRGEDCLVGSGLGLGLGLGNLVTGFQFCNWPEG